MMMRGCTLPSRDGLGRQGAVCRHSYTWRTVYDQGGPNTESKMTRRSQRRISKNRSRTSLEVQWLLICLPMQGTQVPSLVGRPHMLRSNEVREPQLRKPARPEPVLCNKRSHRHEQPTRGPRQLRLEQSRAATKTP